MANRLLSPRECRQLGLQYQAPASARASADLKNACGILAVMKAWRLLRDEGVRSRILKVENGGGAHAVLVYGATDGSHFSFDEGGTLPLPGVTTDSSAIDAARVFLKQMSRVHGKDVRPVTRATWDTA